MNSNICSKHVVAVVSAMVFMTMLILALKAPRPGARGEVHNQTVRQLPASMSRTAGPRGIAEMKPRPHEHEFIHEVLTSAISIAHRI